MPKIGNVHKLDSFGRVYLPIKLRKALGINLSEPVVVQIGEGVLRLRKATPATGQNDLAANHFD